MLVLVKTISNPSWLLAPDRLLLVTASCELAQPVRLVGEDLADADATRETLAEVAGSVTPVDVGAATDAVAVAVALAGGEAGPVGVIPSEEDEQPPKAMTERKSAAAPRALRPTVPRLMLTVGPSPLPPSPVLLLQM